MRYRHLLVLAAAMAAISSCSSGRLRTSGVAYQSVRMVNAKNPEEVSKSRIAAGYSITEDGALVIFVKNNSDEVLTIDQTKTFFVNTDGLSTSFYDPTVRTTTVTDMASSTNGASLNLGAITNMLGIGGPLGTLAQGLNVGNESTAGSSTSNTTMIADLPTVSISPHGGGYMTKEFKISGLGRTVLNSDRLESFVAQDSKMSPLRFSVCITYSFDGGATFDKLMTDFYVNSQCFVPVGNSRNINDAVRKIVQTYNSAVFEPWWMIHVCNNVLDDKRAHSSFTQGALLDYK